MNSAGAGSSSYDGSGSSTLTSKRSFSEMEGIGMHDVKVESSPYSCSVASPAMSSGSCDIASSDCDGDDKLKSSKKMKIEWTRELHERFVQAVESLGTEKAVPSRILECMGAYGNGLTRQNIASHLQKYRHRSRGKVSLSESQSGMSTPSPAAETHKCGQSFLPSPPSAALPLAHVAQGPIVMSGNSVTGSASPAPAGTQPQWVQAIPMWSPWPQTAMVQTCVSPQLSMPGLAALCPNTSVPSGISAEVKKAIKDVLAQNHLNTSPLGLSLDRIKMVENIQPMSKSLLQPIPLKKQSMR